mmetsp:Transcript_53743/g.142937  ORF Transcript_53743/g.142937 Transcript_53743/m.142937 type:complete len:313 (+) Transcript_53743:1179-2117(+)
MQSTWSDCNAALSDAWSFLAASRSAVAVALLSVCADRDFFMSTSSLFWAAPRWVNVCWTISKLNLASVSALVAADRCPSAFSSMSSRTWMIVLEASPLFDSECELCKKALTCAVSCVANIEPSSRTGRVCCSLSMTSRFVCSSPAASCRFNTLIALESVSMVSASSASCEAHAFRSSSRIFVAFSSSASSSAIDSDRSEIREFAVSMPDSACSIAAFRSSTSDAACATSCCSSLALSSHHSTNWSYCLPSASPSAVILADRLSRSLITFCTGLPPVAAAAQPATHNDDNRMVERSLARRPGRHPFLSLAETA